MFFDQIESLKYVISLSFRNGVNVNPELFFSIVAHLCSSQFIMLFVVYSRDKNLILRLMKRKDKRKGSQKNKNWAIIKNK